MRDAQRSRASHAFTGRHHLPCAIHDEPVEFGQPIEFALDLSQIIYQIAVATSVVLRI